MYPSVRETLGASSLLLEIVQRPHSLPRPSNVMVCGLMSRQIPIFVFLWGALFLKGSRAVK